MSQEQLRAPAGGSPRGWVRILASDNTTASGLTLKKRPHFGDQCINCTNTKPTGGLVVDAGPTVIYCKCNPGTGAAQADWPTAIFDISQWIPRDPLSFPCSSADHSYP